MGILPQIVNGITSAIGNVFNGGSILGAAGSPLFGSIAIGRKKRSNSEEISNNLQIIRERLIRTGMFDFQNSNLKAFYLYCN